MPQITLVICWLDHSLRLASLARVKEGKYLHPRRAARSVTPIRKRRELRPEEEDSATTWKSRFCIRSRFLVI
jgi:hypothetical protein